jgi:hypothetical protein
VDYYERLAIEYQKAQDSAEHHDTLLWTATSIIWAGNLVLIGFVLDSIKKNELRIILILLSVLGIFLVSTMCVIAKSFRKVKQQKYNRCKELERILGFKQHRDLKYPNRIQTFLYYFITIIFLIFWIIVIFAVWAYRYHVHLTPG